MSETTYTNKRSDLADQPSALTDYRLPSKVKRKHGWKNKKKGGKE